MGRAGITQTPVLIEKFKKLRNYRIGWDLAGRKPSCPIEYKEAIKKYFENIRTIKCLLKNISVPVPSTCEASCVGLSLGIVWDKNDPTTQLPPFVPSLSAELFVNPATSIQGS